jgi:hypothetical protein
MENIDNIGLITQIFFNNILFESIDDINKFKIQICKDYDEMNLYICSKDLNSNINPNNYIKQLSKIEIRNSLFNSYLDTNKIKEIDNNNWIEKSIYDKKNYNIQRFIMDNNSLLCFSDLELDDDSYDFMWINNPYTKIFINENNKLHLFIAFENSNQYQEEILSNFLLCLNKLELAFSNN